VKLMRGGRSARREAKRDFVWYNKGKTGRTVTSAKIVAEK
jgi:hypothetical protein